MKTKIYSLLLIVGLFSSCDHFLGVDQKGMVIPKTVEDYDLMLNCPSDHTDMSNLYFMVPEINIKNFAAIEENGASTANQNGYRWEPFQYLPDEEDKDYSSLYTQIYACNEIIDHIDEAECVMKNETLRAEVKGQAYAKRAACYWALVNLYGTPYSKANADKPGVAIVLKNDLSQRQSRASVGEVYDLICGDLRIAAPLVPEQVAAVKNIRAGKVAVEAFRAKVFLFMNEIDSAYNAINDAFVRTGSWELEDYNQYTAGKTEQPYGDISMMVRPERKLEDIIWTSGFSYYVSLNASFVVKEDFLTKFYNDSDLRFLINFGYISEGEDITPDARYQAFIGGRTYLVSLSEMYLLKAEIYARKGKVTDAMDVLNQFRKKRFLTGSDYSISAIDAADALQKVKEERVREYACNLLNWLDLRRYQAYGETVPTFTRQIGDKTLTLAPGSNLYILSIPRYVISKNPNIVQNPR